MRNRPLWIRTLSRQVHESSLATAEQLGRKQWAQTLVTGVAAGLATVGIVAVGKAVLLGQWWKIGTLIFYAMLLILFVIRRRTTNSSQSAPHWFFALSGTFLPFAMSSTESQHTALLFWGTLPLQLAGMSISIIAMSALGRSFGVIAANRSIKIDGPYAIVRHPLYLGEAIWFLSIILQNLSWYNLLIFAVQISCQIRRIFDEEALLGRDHMYQQYRNRVHYRLIRRLF
jgi:protein-S-isoprenylcysteine O-methyltransferase Ste14